jgi:hypothetical protein
VSATLLDLARHADDCDAWDDLDEDGIDAGDLAELDVRIGRVGRCVAALDLDPLASMSADESIPRHLRHAGRRM